MTASSNNPYFGNSLRFFWCAVMATLIMLPARLAAQSSVSKEYQIKAVFLFNFAQFIEWPSTAFSTNNAPFRIGILGDDPFGSALEETIRNESINNHKLVIQHARNAADLVECQLIFISKSERSHLNDILAGLGSHPILTVSENEGFARRGGMINFYLEERKVRFEINPATAQGQGLKISSQLLSLGKIVKPAAGKEDK